MNGYLWIIAVVSTNDQKLVDRTGKLTVATTDPKTHTVYLSEILYGDFLMTVFIHELGHCALWSFNLIPMIHRMVKREYWVDMEEFICNFLADYGLSIYQIAYKSLGYKAWQIIPTEFEKYIA